MTKRQKQNKASREEQRRRQIYDANRKAPRYRTWLDGIRQKNPIRPGEDGYETAAYEFRVVDTHEAP